MYILRQCSWSIGRMLLRSHQKGIRQFSTIKSIGDLKEKYFKATTIAEKINHLQEIISLRKRTEKQLTATFMLEKAELAKYMMDGSTDANIELISEYFNEKSLASITFNDIPLQHYPKGYQQFLNHYFRLTHFQCVLHFTPDQLSSDQFHSILSDYGQVITEQCQFMQQFCESEAQKAATLVNYQQQEAAIMELLGRAALRLSRLDLAEQLYSAGLKLTQEIISRIEKIPKDTSQDWDYEKQNALIKQVQHLEGLADIHLQFKGLNESGRRYLAQALSLYKQLEGEDSYQYQECLADLIYTYYDTDKQRAFDLADVLFKKVSTQTHLASCLQVHVLYFILSFDLGKDCETLYEKVEIMRRFSSLKLPNLELDFQVAAIKYAVRHTDKVKLSHHLESIKMTKNTSFFVQRIWELAFELLANNETRDLFCSTMAKFKDIEDLGIIQCLCEGPNLEEIMYPDKPSLKIPLANYSLAQSFLSGEIVASPRLKAYLKLRFEQRA